MSAAYRSKTEGQLGLSIRRADKAEADLLAANELIDHLTQALPCGCHPRLESQGKPAQFSGGCGDPVIAPQAIVCADCGAWYCSRACISKHFGKEPNEAIAALEAECERLRAMLTTQSKVA